MNSFSRDTGTVPNKSFKQRPFVPLALFFAYFFFYDKLPFYTFCFLFPFCFDIPSLSLYLFFSAVLFCRLLIPDEVGSSSCLPLKEYVTKLYGARAYFVETLLLGEPPSLHLCYLFGSFGLSHLIAISGFHFQVLLNLLRLFLLRFFPKRESSILLILFASTYLFVIRPAPSAFRAFICFALVFMGQLLRRKSDVLNLLAFSFICLVLLHPSWASNRGCHLSFLATYGILSHYREILSWFRLRWGLKETTRGVLFVDFILQGLSLQFAVLLMTLPYMVLSFGSFSLGSLLMNLWVPPLFAPLLLLLVSSLFFPCLVNVGAWCIDGLILVLEAIPKSWMKEIYFPFYYRELIVFTGLFLFFYPQFKWRGWLPIRLGQTESKFGGAAPRSNPPLDG